MSGPQILKRRDPARPLLVAVFALAGLLASATVHANGVWYVNNTSPKASDTGFGSPDKPYLTIGAALAAHRDSGVTIVVHGGPYREKVVINAPGTGSAPTVVRTDGTPVVIDGADDFSQVPLWTPVAGNVWLAAGVTWSPGHVYADGVRLLQSTSAPAVLATNEWTWVAGAGLYVNAGGDNPASHLAAVGHRTHGFLVSGHSHVFIAGFTIQRAEEKGVELVSDSNVVVKRNVIRQCGSGGIAVRGGQDVQVYGNTVSDSNHHGIELREGVTNSLVDNNESFGNLHVGVSWATGIYLADSPNNRIANNRLHDNQDSGCEIQTGSNDNLVCQNLSWNNGDHGFAQLYATGTLLMNNDAWGNHTEGFAVEGSSTGTRLYNCISVNRALDPGSYCVLVDTSSTVGFEADYNIYWGDQPPIKFNNKVYASVAAFQAATGIGPHTFGTDPRFVDAAHGDFNLLSDSPAIDDANTTIPGWEPLDANGFIRIDVPGMPNTGTGPVGFADRGALEFRNSVLAVGDGAGAAALALSPAFPNPSRRAVAFTLRLASAADVDFAVYDVLGREVWSERGVRPAGASTLRWTLTGADGARVPNGLYLARVRHGSDTETARFVITR